MLIKERYLLKRLQKHVPYRLFSTFKYRFLISFITFILVVLLGFFIAIRPTQQHLTQLQFKTKAMQQQLQSKLQTKHVYTKQRALHKKLKKMLIPFYSIKPDYLVATSLVNELEIWSKTNSIQLRKVIWGQLIESEYLTVQPVSLDLSGRYTQIILLFHFISTHYGYLDVVKFEIHKSTNLQVAKVNAVDSIPSLSLALELHVYMLKS